jgi:hypothetical protein
MTEATVQEASVQAAPVAKRGRKTMFQYFSPMLYPMFPKEHGALLLEADLQHMLKKCAADPDADAEITVRFDLFIEGEKKTSEEMHLKLRNGKVDLPHFIKEFTSDGLGYLEFMVAVDRPLLRKPYVGDDYVLWIRPGKGSVSFGAEAKYALDRVIEQIKTYGQFCLLHTGAYVDPKRKAGNSIMFMNPYEQTIRVRLVSSSGRKISLRVPAKCTRIADLTPILDEGKWDTVMITASNRIPTYDLRHPTGEPCEAYSIDHLDTFSGYATHRAVGPGPYLRDKARRWLRYAGLRYR